MTEEQDIPFRDDEERALFEEARLGSDALLFLRTNLGRWLQAVAEQERTEAMEELLEVDCTDGLNIAKHQMKAAIAGNFLRWMGEAIQNGRIAEQQLEQMDEEADL